MGRIWRRLVRWLRYGRGMFLGSALRRRWLLATHPGADIRFEGPVYLGRGFSLHMPDGGTFVVGPGVEFRRNFRAEISRGGRVRIGGGTVFTYDCLIQCTTSIEVGERCLFAQGVLLVDGSHRFRDLDRPIAAQGYDYRPLKVGPDAGVMAKCTVIADVGERAFVGANSVVTRPVPPYSLAAGTPARVIEEFGPARPGSTRAARP